jgi:hypothetical protein
MDSKPREGAATSYVTVRATPSVKTMFTASPTVGTLAGLQLPGTFQLPVPSVQFFATARMGMVPKVVANMATHSGTNRVRGMMIS